MTGKVFYAFEPGSLSEPDFFDSFCKFSGLAVTTPRLLRPKALSLFSKDTKIHDLFENRKESQKIFGH